MKAENGDVGVATVADRSTAIFAADRMGGVLDDAEPIAVTERLDAPHITGLAAEMHRHDDLGERTVGLGVFELGRKRIGTHIAGVQIDIDEIDLRAAVKPAIRGSGEGVRRCPKPVARS